MDCQVLCPVASPTLHDHLKVLLCKCFSTFLDDENEIALLASLTNHVH